MLFFRLILLTAFLLPIFSGVCLKASESPAAPSEEIVVSVKEQKLMLLSSGKPVGTYTISTSRFGTGDRFGSFATPLGKFVIRTKIGMGLPLGAVLHSREPTGEILKPNAPGRDPIVSRILWLDGSEPGNRNAFQRCIYIHGTPREKELGHPASYGCIRMRSVDVAELSRRVETGASVTIVTGPLPKPGVLHPAVARSEASALALHIPRESPATRKQG
jgi:L,D-transpeptidase catalytic domain